MEVKMERNGQVWIETVIYTLIGLILIGLILIFITPKINQTRDKLLVEQSIEALSIFDNKLQEIGENSAGNVRIIQSFQIKRGIFIINSSLDELLIILEDIKSEYSEPEQLINFGRVKIKTEKTPKGYRIKLIVSSNKNITYNGEDKLTEFSGAPIPYKFSLTNMGNNNIDIKEISGR